MSACDRGEAPAERRQGEPDRPGRETGRRAAPLGLQDLEIQREGLRGRRERREAVAAAKGCEIGPVVGVGPLRRRRVVRGREVVLDGPRELRKDGSASLERLDRDQGVPTSAVSGDRTDLGAIHGRFHVHLFHRKSS